jgi:hypothetical protein
MNATYRVEIPPYTDRWMMGDRYGAVVKISRQRHSNAVRAELLTHNRFARDREIAHVKLDKSGKTVRVILDDCRPV